MESLLEQTDIARRKGRIWRKIRNTTFLVIVSGFLAWGWLFYFYSIEDGFQIGTLNKLVTQGTIFKTYEGILILENDRSFSLNKFEFSIVNKKLYDDLTNYPINKSVKLYYKKYFKTIPWRGSSKYVVYDFENISEKMLSTENNTKNTQFI
ncbi:MAG: hypothetical protein LBD80_06510 [Tannerella sp.]|jgi:hypothetical protein|nr:hypothetical protein [Tannerella sp.]